MIPMRTDPRASRQLGKS